MLDFDRRQTGFAFCLRDPLFMVGFVVKLVLRKNTLR